MDYKELLNEKQFEAVSTASQFVRIVAGAGSGKTRVLTYRISYLISEMDVNPRSILAIAFTNKVATEMKERACKLVPSAGPFLSISTFHSFCAKFLRIECSAISFPSNFTIFDEDDQEKLVKSIAVDLGYKKKDDIVSQSLDFIRSNKCYGRYPEQIKNANTESLKECLKIYNLYEEQKSGMYGMDFDDLLMRTIQILEDFPEIRLKWQRRIDHILIDEFQDTNDVQFKLVKLLLKPSTCLYVVGDPDQTIYTWRGANQNIILQFDKTFKNVDTIILDRNYRSTKTILNTANELISHNRKRVKKNLYTENDQGGDVTVYQGYTKDLEAEWVIKTIERLAREKENFSYRDVAILYRASYLTLPFEKQLTKFQIPYRLFGGVRFYQRKEIKDVLAYVRLIFNTLDDVSFERIINVPRRGIGDVSFDKLKEEKNTANLSFYNYILKLSQYKTTLPTRVVISLTNMVNIIEKYRPKFADNLEIYSKVIEEMIKELGYIDYLAIEDDGDDRLENVRALFADMYDYIKKNPESTFEQYLQNVSLATSQDDIEDGNYVSLMTIHIAKGLEFPYVFLVGLNEGVFPSLRTTDESGNDGLEEERRLCYVAFTRAKKELYVTCNTDYSFVLGSRSIPSRFFAESCLKIPSSNSPFVRQYPESLDHRNNRFFNDDVDDTSYTPPPKPQDNGIDDWRIGDIVFHKNFGEGIVTKVIDDGVIIEVNFDSCGKKTLLSKHPMISRKEHIGGKA
jgi:DNA helicase-2/ATP-dependent DNA helicase PcrA